MDPFILNLGIRWLAAVDAFSASSCVSQEWRQFLSADRDNGDFWKQICLNSGPSDIPSLANSNDYLHLAMGLRLRDNKEPPASQEKSYTPSTTAENYFAVVDVYKRHEEQNGKRRKEMIASLTCPIEDSEFVRREEQSEPTFRGMNPYSAEMKDSNEVREWRQQVSSNNHYWGSTPLAYAARAVSKETQGSPRHQIDVTLFRRDNAKSVCLLHGTRLADDFDYDDEQVLTYTGFVELTLAGNDTGMIARGLIDESSSISVECFMSFALVSPASGSGDQPQWLTNCRQAYQDRRVYEPSASDMDVLSKVGHFEFGLEEVNIRFYTSNEWDINQLEGQNEFIIVLEGLCWE